MQIRELGRLALAALVGAAITATCLLSIDEELHPAQTAPAGACDCACRAEVDLEAPSLVQTSRRYVEAPAPLPHARARAASLIQASSAPASASALPTEGFGIAFGALHHEESAWLSPTDSLSDQASTTQTTVAPKHLTDKEAHYKKEDWVNWTREELERHNISNDGRDPEFRNPPLEVESRRHDVDFLGAALWLLTVTCIPLFFVTMYGSETTWTHCLQSLALLCWLVWGLFMFCFVITFESSHWTGQRQLNLVETVYLVAQVITTVGYGDIIPYGDEGKLVMGIFVLAGLVLIANVVSQINNMLLASVEDLTLRLKTQTLTDTEENAQLNASMSLASSTVASSAVASSAPSRSPTRSRSGLRRSDTLVNGKKTWKDWLHNTVHLTHMESKLGNALMIYLSLCTVGVLFFHYSEEKTWLEATYMVIVTSTSLGFGACTPITRRGFAFSAFWMVFACGALGLVIGNFSQLMMYLEREEQVNLPKRRREFRMSCEYVRQQEGGRVNRYEFTRLMLLWAGMVQTSDLICLESTFKHLEPDEEDLVKVEDIEAACFIDDLSDT